MESTLILRQDKVLDIDQTDNIVLVILIDRKPGIHGIPENCQNIVISSIQTDRYHIDAWNHDILGVGIGKIEHIVDQLAFLGFDDTVLMTDVHVGFQLAFSHGAGFFVGIDM